jgi:hypothetical protein
MPASLQAPLHFVQQTLSRSLMIFFTGPADKKATDDLPARLNGGARVGAKL